jgi:uncharacterized membrane protein (DUF373 family)
MPVPPFDREGGGSGNIDPHGSEADLVAHHSECPTGDHCCKLLTMRPAGAREQQFRNQAGGVFRYIEDAFYVGVAVVLALAGLALFINALFRFVTEIGDGSFSSSILSLLDSMLLVFIFTELIHTISAVVRENVLLTEPFLIVGIVAVIRRLIVISAEAKDIVGTDQFGDLMLEIGILTGTLLGLGAVIFLLRHTSHSEPRPSYEPSRDGEG